MNHAERQRAQAEALEAAGATRSADRARFWAGMNRYLAANARHAHKKAEAERAAEGKPTRQNSD